MSSKVRRTIRVHRSSQRARLFTASEPGGSARRWVALAALNPGASHTPAGLAGVTAEPYARGGLAGQCCFGSPVSAALVAPASNGRPFLSPLRRPSTPGSPAHLL